ncbi:Sulfate transporter/antisigma-factor antagonist STAS [Actinobacteria bacterium OK074]|nr:Sulfate transporter/antisigma-factor antagonist STAS [Actinobacteria bacterium OK074]
MPCEVSLGYTGTAVTLRLAGQLGEPDVPRLRSALEQAEGRPLRRLILRLHELESIDVGGVRSLAFAQQRLRPESEVVVDGARERVRQAFRSGGLDPALTYLETPLL